MKKFLVIAVGAVLILCVLLSIFHSCTGKKVEITDAGGQKNIAETQIQHLAKNIGIFRARQ